MEPAHTGLHCAAWLSAVTEHQNWHHFLFTHKMTVTQDTRDRVWRCCGGCYAVCNIIQHHWFGGLSVRVWQSTCLESHTDVHVVPCIDCQTWNYAMDPGAGFTSSHLPQLARGTNGLWVRKTVCVLMCIWINKLQLPTFANMNQIFVSPLSEYSVKFLVTSRKLAKWGHCQLQAKLIKLWLGCSHYS